jgi:hypothetical protein
MEMELQEQEKERKRVRESAMDHQLDMMMTRESRCKRACRSKSAAEIIEREREREVSSNRYDNDKGIKVQESLSK